MKIDGCCHCGEITFEAEVNPDNVVICHCTDCQAMSGAPYRVNVPVLIGKLALQGTPKIYVKRGDSGREVTTTFCVVCGTPIYSCKGEAPEFVWLRIGSVTQRAQLVPRRQGFCSSAMPWAMDIRDVPQVAPGPSSGGLGRR